MDFYIYWSLSICTISWDSYVKISRYKYRLFSIFPFSPAWFCFICFKDMYIYMSEKAMATHSSTLAWKIPWTEEPGGLQSMGSLRVGHDWETSLSLSLSCTGEGNGNPLQCSCLENPKGGGAWWAAVYGVAQSRTWLKQLSSSSSNSIYICVCLKQLRITLSFWWDDPLVLEKKNLFKMLPVYSILSGSSKNTSFDLNRICIEYLSSFPVFFFWLFHVFILKVYLL